jgi:uncharacterized protein YndB with AHSA1/START domain
MKTILHTVDIDAAPDKVYQALTTQRGLAGWWSTRVAAETRLGGTIRFTFLSGFHPVMEITELVPVQRVGWTCIGGHDPWLDNHFRFELEERDGGTVLFFRHEYSTELSDEEYGRYNFNWGYYLQSLLRYCLTGVGAPFLVESDDG